VELVLGERGGRGAVLLAQLGEHQLDVAPCPLFGREHDLSASFDDAQATLVEARDHLGELRLYVVVTSGKRQLAVFRVRNDGQLKRMRRPPRELRGEDE
jgi:hypothetical protein